MKLVKPHSPSEKVTRTTVDTIELTLKLTSSWQVPPFQRTFSANTKVRELIEELKANGGVLPGVLTLGVLNGVVYIVDGQHRIKAFELAELKCGYADVRQHYFNDMVDMADEFVRLNSQLVRLRTDDLLRGLESNSPEMQRVRKRCPFIGYDHIRRGGTGPVLSMSTFLRCWVGSRGETPAVTVPATVAVKMMTSDEAEAAMEFISLCFSVWQRDAENARLWSGLNLMLLAWLYRRIVLGEGQTGTSRWTRFSKDDFRRGLAALSSDVNYLDFLHGRNVSSRDRAPAYARIKTIMGKRFFEENKRKALFPQPAWVHSQGS
jgi:ribosomal protein L29